MLFRSYPSTGQFLLRLSAGLATRSDCSKLDLSAEHRAIAVYVGDIATSTNNGRSASGKMLKVVMFAVDFSAIPSDTH